MNAPKQDSWSNFRPYYQGRIKRTGHVTTIFHITNGRERMSKNREEFIARALYAPDALSLASVLGRFFV